MEQNAEIINQAIEGSLSIIDQDREREIVARRFGLTGPKETLEQIGEMLTITRERVRQLEKAILIRLRIGSEDGTIPNLAAAEKLLIRNLTETGRVARLNTLAEKIYGNHFTSEDLCKLAFIGEISSSLVNLEGNDRLYSSIGIAEYGDRVTILTRVDEVVELIKKIGHPVSVEELDQSLDYEHPDHITAIASLSCQLACLNGLWGLTKWPTVNPKNIRDKIYVVLSGNGSPMHFSDISKAISASNFRRKNVTTQAIHNELIKDPRFVLIGRGIYALSEWGYKKGTVSEIIVETMKEENRPLTREEIVRAVLHSRRVKETTILLKLQNKKLFKKTDKDHYTLA